MNVINFYNFIKNSDTEEVLSAQIKEKDNTIQAMFYLNKDIEIENQTKMSKKNFLLNKYKGLVDLYLLKENEYFGNTKKIMISIKPELD